METDRAKHHFMMTMVVRSIKHRMVRSRKKKIPKAVAVTGFALLFGVVSSGTFLASNVVGSKVLGLTGVTKTNTTATKAVSSNASLSKSSSVVTSDVSSIVENVMPSIVSITNMSVQQVQDFLVVCHSNRAKVLEQESLFPE